jgi:hypothetical protein
MNNFLPNFLPGFLKKFLTVKKQKLEKDREDFIVLEKEVNEGKRKVTGIEWADILGKATREGNKLTPEEHTLLPRFFSSLRIHLLGKNISERSLSFNFKDADEIIEPPVYREVLTYYEEELTKIVKIEKDWDQISWDKMKSIEFGLNVFYLEKLEKISIIFEEIDREMQFRETVEYWIMRIDYTNQFHEYFPPELRAELVKQFDLVHKQSDIDVMKTLGFGFKGIDRKKIRNELKKFSKELLFETKKISFDEVSKIFEKKISVIIKKLINYLEKNKFKKTAQTISQAFKNYKKRTELTRIAEIFKKYFQELKQKREKAHSLLKKHIKNWKAKKEQQRQQSEYSQKHWQKQHQFEKEQNQNYEKAWKQESDRLTKWEEEKERNRRNQHYREYLQTEQQAETAYDQAWIAEVERLARLEKERSQRPTITVSRYTFIIAKLEKLGVKITNPIRISLMRPFYQRKEISQLHQRILRNDQVAIQQLKNEEYLTKLLKNKVKYEAHQEHANQKNN